MFIVLILDLRFCPFESVIYIDYTKNKAVSSRIGILYVCTGKNLQRYRVRTIEKTGFTECLLPIFKTLMTRNK